MVDRPYRKLAKERQRFVTTPNPKENDEERTERTYPNKDEK